MKKNLMSLVALVLVFSLFFSGCKNNSDVANYAVKIGDTYVSVPEFKFYLYEAQKQFENIGGSDIWETDFEGETAENVAKETALNSLRIVTIAVENAKKYNVFLTDEEKQEAKKEAQSQFDVLTEAEKESMEINIDIINDVIESNHIYSKVYNEVTKNYELSEADFEVYYDIRKSELMNRYIRYKIQTIFVDNREMAENVQRRLNLGEDFELLFKEYGNRGHLENNQYYKWQLEDFFNIDFDLNIGEISNILETYEGYYIIKILDKDDKNEENVKSIARDLYKSQMQRKLFDDEFIKWSSSVSVEKNEKIWNEISLIQH